MSNNTEQQFNLDMSVTNTLSRLTSWHKEGKMSSPEYVAGVAALLDATDKLVSADLVESMREIVARLASLTDTVEVLRHEETGQFVMLVPQGGKCLLTVMNSNLIVDIAFSADKALEVLKNDGYVTQGE